MGEIKGSTENIVKISWLKKKKGELQSFFIFSGLQERLFKGIFYYYFLSERQNQSILMDSLGNDNNTILLNYRERDCEIRLAG